ncbi:hypothetical protein SGFS_071200 [Streptomyces graminofaciens]|uniref:Secreted protein n=1 Tax=Streptomyces graminofaciens TaxID=68212 RepID=A0ABM7FI92_9ACTN|nr:hypothetical protein SGFS_071200 [Streptomyces graminofaciens]
MRRLVLWLEWCLEWPSGAVSGAAVRRGCLAWLSGVAVWRGCPAWLSGAAVRRGRLARRHMIKSDQEFR